MKFIFLKIVDILIHLDLHDLFMKLGIKVITRPLFLIQILRHVYFNIANLFYNVFWLTWVLWWMRYLSWVVRYSVECFCWITGVLVECHNSTEIFFISLSKIGEKLFICNIGIPFQWCIDSLKAQFTEFLFRNYIGRVLILLHLIETMAVIVLALKTVLLLLINLKSLLLISFRVLHRICNIWKTCHLSISAIKLSIISTILKSSAISIFTLFWVIFKNMSSIIITEAIRYITSFMCIKIRVVAT